MKNSRLFWQILFNHRRASIEFWHYIIFEHSVWGCGAEDLSGAESYTLNVIIFRKTCAYRQWTTDYGDFIALKYYYLSSVISAIPGPDNNKSRFFFFTFFFLWPGPDDGDGGHYFHKSSRLRRPENVLRPSKNLSSVLVDNNVRGNNNNNKKKIYMIINHGLVNDGGRSVKSSRHVPTVCPRVRVRFGSENKI